MLFFFSSPRVASTITSPERDTKYSTHSTILAYLSPLSCELCESKKHLHWLSIPAATAVPDVQKVFSNYLFNELMNEKKMIGATTD